MKLLKEALLGLALMYTGCNVQQCETPMQIRAVEMIESRVPVVSGADFNRRILQHEGVSVVDFYAEWCGYCQRFDPAYGRVADSLSSRMSFFKFNIDVNNDRHVEHPEILDRYTIRGIPTVLVFRDGEVICRPSPSDNPAEFQRRLEDCLR